MAKERAAKKERKRDKKVSDDKVTKSGKQKRRAEPLSDTSDEDSDGGASVDVKSSKETSVVESPDSEITKPKGDKKTKKSKKSKKEAQVEAEAEDDTTDGGGAMLFSVDTNPTPVDLATVKTAAPPKGSSNGDNEQTGLKKIAAPSGMNRQARRRIKMIEQQRDIIKKKKGIPEGSREREDEVQKDLDRWTETLDRKTAVRLEKKRARKSKEQARLRSRRGKLLTGRKLKEREKEIKKAEKKASKKTGIS
ncbi:hypothetical protein F5B22DRAFT_589426 [Xylaria bambusicola]|uniref:uncharacterized protein n=1 Tax=Xylaria bambusicola TaxID=326684 RepID=UPI002007B9D7|nr:uncharacterized protein F5B22DRAFT_589426 [Xylaria bambusicola]KAI0525317.1 hypothetical protein F5B22DRAFT_589426 [Xylaria bambusicola]